MTTGTRFTFRDKTLVTILAVGIWLILALGWTVLAWGRCTFSQTVAGLGISTLLFAAGVGVLWTLELGRRIVVSILATLGWLSFALYWIGFAWSRSGWHRDGAILLSTLFGCGAIVVALWVGKRAQECFGSNAAAPRFPWLYLIAAYALAWLFWIPVALTRQDYQESPVLLIAVLAGVFGPGIAGIVLTYVEGGRGERRDYWRRMVDARRIRPLWWLVLFGLWPLLHGIAIALGRLLGAEPPTVAFVREIAAQPFAIVVVPALYLLQAALEELGWRGYMLDRLQARFRPLVASLLLGICHALWHLPLFWIVGTNQIKWGFGLDFWLFIAVVVASSVYSTWCYNSNNRSTLAATILHFTYNLSLDIFTSPGMQQRILNLVLIVVAVALAWGRTNQSRANTQRRFHGQQKLASH